MENQKTDLEVILETLKFIKENKSDDKNYVNPKESPEFSSLSKERQTRIRDRIVVNKFASMPNIGKEWELAITWHPDEGVDVLNNKNVKKILNENGTFNLWNNSLNHLKRYLITIIVSIIAGVLGGIFLIYIAPFISGENSNTSEQSQTVNTETSFWTEFVMGLEKNNTQFLISNSLDSIQCAECNFIEGQVSEYYKSAFIFGDPERIKKLMHLNSLLATIGFKFNEDVLNI